MPNVNPEILIWARETSGLSIGAAAEKLGINEARGIVRKIACESSSWREITDARSSSEDVASLPAPPSCLLPERTARDRRPGRRFSQLARSRD
jgi:hypothetical protein